jgi:hypothetical protein
MAKTGIATPSTPAPSTPATAMPSSGLLNAAKRRKPPAGCAQAAARLGQIDGSIRPETSLAPCMHSIA